ncbi:MAG: glycosyltransferase [Leptospiraceae bacterium]|nr:glycosyltransferase [Leptospiraceae bacterium]
MKHIALFLPDLQGGGAERVMLTLAKGFVEEGHRVDVVLARAEGALLPLVADGVRVVGLRAGLRRWGLAGLALSATVRLAGYLRREKPDVLLSTLTGANLVAVIAWRLAGRSARLVLREAVTLRNLKSTWRLRLMRWLYRQADAVVALTEVMRQELISRVGLSASKVVCIPNPVDVDFVQSQAAMELDHPWFAPGSSPVIMGIGRLSQQKNFGMLIRAFAELRSRGVMARLVILGEGPLRNELEDLIRELRIENDVLLPGFDVNPYRWLARSQVFVLSSLWEGYPNVILEALALGKGIVIVSYDLSVELLSLEKKLIKKISAGDWSEMADAIHEILCLSTENQQLTTSTNLSINIKAILKRYLDSMFIEHRGFKGLS